VKFRFAHILQFHNSLLRWEQKKKELLSQEMDSRTRGLVNLCSLEIEDRFFRKNTFI